MYKKTIPLTLAMIIVLVIMPRIALAGKIEPDNSAPAKSTVFLIIDGLQQSHLKYAQAPNIKGLMNSGMAARKVTGVPDSIAGAVSTLLTGDKNALEEAVSRFYHNQSKQDIKTVFIDGTSGKLKHLAAGADVAPKGHFNQNQVITAAIKEIDSHKDTCTIMVLPRVEPQNLVTTDNQIGLLLNHLRKESILNNSIIALTGTTGTPPVILNGPRIKGSISVPMASFGDIAATVSFLNNQNPPGNGMVLYEAIEPNGAQSSAYLLQQRVNELAESYARATGEIEQMRQEQKDVQHQQAKLDEEKAKYTTVIKKQQHEINHLKLKITLFKIAGWLVFLLFLMILYLEYRFLKKRFMFFT